jgi:hydrogenase/urease accessory protein HupE
MLRWWGVLVCVLGVVGQANAHPMPFSYVDIRSGPTAVELTVVVHVFDAAHDLDVTPPERFLDPSVAAAYAEALRTRLARRLELAADGRILVGQWTGPEVVKEQSSLRFRVEYRVSAPPGRVRFAARLFPYDLAHQTFVNVYEGGALRTQAILDYERAEVEFFANGRQGAVAVMRKFVPAGIHHILVGPDHLLFLVGLLLLGGTIRRLLVVVTSFTIAHSVTLSLAALNIVTPPARVIEPAIALSIVYVGADNLLARGGRDFRPFIALTFGFIHGFGFANVLREMRLPPGALGWSLFSFNLGVEIGQLLVVLAVAWAFSTLRSRSEAAGRRLALAGSVVVMAAGAFWFIQRVFFASGVS